MTFYGFIDAVAPYIIVSDFLGLVFIIYGVFIRPRLERIRMNRVKPFNGTYLEITFYDAGVKTGNMPPINITEMMNETGGYLNTWLEKIWGRPIPKRNAPQRVNGEANAQA